MRFSASEAHDFPEERQDSFDPARLLNVCEGDREFAKDLAGAFLESGRESLDLMTSSIATGRTTEVFATAHKLKGSALAIAAESLARLCGEMESACSNPDGSGLSPLSERIQAEFALVESTLRPLVEE